MIPKSELESGAWYLGRSRLGHVALWDQEAIVLGVSNGAFLLTTYSMGQFYLEALPHPDDEDKYAVFEPLSKIEEPERKT